MQAARTYGRCPSDHTESLGCDVGQLDLRIVDGLAATKQVIAFNYRGVGASRGKAPLTVAEMAKDAIAFIHALGFDEVDLLGFSLGGFVAQTSS